MNKGLWLARKNHLWCLMKKVSDYYGGDDVDWLKECLQCTIDSHKDEMIEKAIACYSDIIDNLTFYGGRK